AHRLVPARDRLRVAERPAQPVAEEAPAGRGDGAVEHPEERAAAPAVSPPRGLALAAEDLQVGERRGVEDQPVAGLAEGDAAAVAEVALLRLPRVGQGRRRGGDGGLAVGEAEAAEGGGPELALQEVGGAGGVEQAVAGERRAAGDLALDPVP